MTPSPILSLGHTVLLCRRLAVTRRFYEETLGFTVTIDRPGWVTLSVGGTSLSLRERDGLPFIDDGAPASDGSASVQLAYLVGLADITLWHERLVETGVPVTRGLTDIASWSHRTLFVRDPEVNVVELYSEL